MLYDVSVGCVLAPCFPGVSGMCVRRSYFARSDCRIVQMVRDGDADAVMSEHLQACLQDVINFKMMSLLPVRTHRLGLYYLVDDCDDHQPY